MKRLARCLKAAWLYLFSDVRREQEDKTVRDPARIADPSGTSGPD
jgi:hypothetical protein